MAQPMRNGITFFSLDVDFFEDPKIQFLAARFGIKGEVFIIKLLCSIYRNGYYTDWDDDTAMLFANRVGEGFSAALVNDMLQELFKRSFFDERIFKSFGVLTSRGIQKRYLRAVSRRKNVDFVKEYALVDLEEYSNLCVSTLCTQNNQECKHDVYISSENVDIQDENVSRKEQRRVEKSKVEKSKEHSRIEDPVFKSYFENISPVPVPVEIRMIDSWIKDERLSEGLIIECIKEAARQNVRKLSYVQGIINNVLKEGITTAEQFKSRNRLNKKSNHKKVARLETTEDKALSDQMMDQQLDLIRRLAKEDEDAISKKK